MAQPLSCPVQGVQGLDASWLQGSNDWPRLKGLGYDFAYLREGEAAWAEGDGKFRANLDGCRAAGVACGLYHVLHWDSEGKAQARVARSRMPDFRPGVDLPPAGDWEWIKGLSPRGAWPVARAFLLELGQVFGVKPVLYTSGSFLQEVGIPSDADLASFDLWVAHYGVMSPAIPSWWTSGGPRLWQWWGNAAPIPGMGTAGTTTDRNAFLGDSTAFRAWVAGDTGTGLPVPGAPEVAPGLAVETAPLIQSVLDSYSYGKAP